MDNQLLWGVTVWQLMLAGLLVLSGLACEPILRRLASWVWGPTAAPGTPLGPGRSLIRPVASLVLVGLLMGAAALLQVPPDVAVHLSNALQIALIGAAAFLAMRLINLGGRYGQILGSKDERALSVLLNLFRTAILLVAGGLVVDTAVWPLTDQVGNVLDAMLLWDISALRLLIAVLLLILGFWSRPVVSWLLRRVLDSRRIGEGRVWVKDAQELIPYPLSLVTCVLLWYFVGQILLFPTEPINVRLWVTTALTIALIVVVTFLAWRCLDVCSRLLSRRALSTETRLDDQLIPLARKTLKIVVVVVVSVMILEKMDFSTSSLIASLGVGGLALALAAKDTIANLFGSVVVFTDQPFQVGDGIKVGEVEGIVEEVGLRSTRIRGFDKTMAVVPNQEFANVSVVNLTQRPNRRIRFEVGITYDATASDMEKFLDDLRDLLCKTEGLDHDSAIVHLTEFADSSLTVLVQVLTEAADLATEMALKEALLLSAMRLVDANGLELAFPTRTVHMVGTQDRAPLSDE